MRPVEGGGLDALPVSGGSPYGWSLCSPAPRPARGPRPAAPKSPGAARTGLRARRAGVLPIVPRSPHSCDIAAGRVSRALSGRRCLAWQAPAGPSAPPPTTPAAAPPSGIPPRRRRRRRRRRRGRWARSRPGVLRAKCRGSCQCFRAPFVRAPTRQRRLCARLHARVQAALND